MPVACESALLQCHAYLQSFRNRSRVIYWVHPDSFQSKQNIPGFNLEKLHFLAVLQIIRSPHSYRAVTPRADIPEFWPYLCISLKSLLFLSRLEELSDLIGISRLFSKFPKLLLCDQNSRKIKLKFIISFIKLMAFLLLQLLILCKGICNKCYFIRKEHAILVFGRGRWKV